MSWTPHNRRLIFAYKFSKIPHNREDGRYRLYRVECRGRYSLGLLVRHGRHGSSRVAWDRLWNGADGCSQCVQSTIVTGFGVDANREAEKVLNT